MKQLIIILAAYEVSVETQKEMRKAVKNYIGTRFVYDESCMENEAPIILHCAPLTQQEKSEINKIVDSYAPGNTSAMFINGIPDDFNCEYLNTVIVK